MKCGACGYEYRRDSRMVDDVIRYKSGKRKGEVKAIDKTEITFEVGHAPFMEVTTRKKVDPLGIVMYETEWRSGDFYEKDIFACPECGTLKIEV